MFRNMKIGMRLGLAFGLVLVMLATIAFIGISRLADLNGNVEELVNDRYPKTVLGNDIIDDVNAVDKDMLSVVLEKDAAQEKKFIDEITDTENDVGAKFDKLQAVVNTEKGKELLKIIQGTRSSFNSVQDRFLKAAQEGNSKEADDIVLKEVPKVQKAYFEAVNKLNDAQDQDMIESGKQSAEEYINANREMLFISIAAVLIGLGAAFWITRGITRPLNEAVSVANQLAEGDLNAKIEVTSKDETGRLLASMRDMIGNLSGIISNVRSAADNLSSASEEVSATAQGLSQATSEQSASVEETSASVEQMSASISQNAENAKVTDSMASKAAKEATEGGESVKQTVTAMRQIADKIGIIDDIAYQTNLLALNAAIEAARAGEHGKGFAVVAAEVRKLAERSQVAAQEIGEVASSSVQLAEKAGNLLDEMVPSINKTSDLVQEITAASEEQSSGVSQINTAMEQLNKITQQNASSSEELAATAEEMSSQAEELQQVMGFFKIDTQSGFDKIAKQHKARETLSKTGTTGVSEKLVASHGTSHADPSESEFVKF